jgi:hypothetical protein
MTEWISMKDKQPTREHSHCWVMNTRRGAYGFVAMWYNDNKYFQLDGGHSHLSPALDVTHWYPLPIPEYRLDD